MMKKITLLLAVLFYGFTVNAQVTHFSEDFETETAGNPPSLFTVLNEDACTVNAPTVFTNGSFIVLEDDDQGNVARAQSWVTVTTCTTDDWLITPAIDLTSANSTVKLDWLARSNTGYPETYQVKISTTGNAIADFTTDLFSTTGEAEVWTNHSESLAAYVGNTVYIAFRLNSTDADALSLDEIKVYEPAPNDLELTSFRILGSVAQSYDLASFDHEVVDFSNRNAVEAEVVITNIGTVDADTVIVSLLLANNALTEGENFIDTIYMNPALAVGASYTHTFAPKDLSAIIPSLGTTEAIYFETAVDSSAYNRDVTGDANYKLVFSPTVSYAAPYQAGFEIASGNQFNFDHNVFGWKYLDNDNDGNTMFPYAFSNIGTADGDYSVMATIVNDINPSTGAVDETLQSPEITLGAAAYEFSLYAATLPNQTGSLDLELTDAAGTSPIALGTVSVGINDTLLKKYTFQRIITSAQADYLVNINKTASGFLFFDLFEITELAMPTAPAMTNTWAACDNIASVNFSLENGNTYSIDWGDGNTETITASPATHTYATNGTFTATLTATNILGSANGTTTIEASALPAPTASFAIGQNGTVDNSVDFTTTGGFPCYTYEWIYGDGGLGTGSGSAHTYTANGTFDVILIVTSPTGETATATKQVTITGVGIETIDFVNGINVYPNPVSDVLNIAFELNTNQDVEITVVSIDGKVVNTTNASNVSNVNTTINTSNLSTGMYILNVTTTEGKYTRNLIVK